MGYSESYALTGNAESSLTVLSRQLHAAQVDKGFYEDPLNVDQKLMLIVTEVAEAHEELRSGHEPNEVYYRDDGKPEGFAMELVDVIIRTLDLAAALNIDIGDALETKQAFNSTRPYKHGRSY